MKPYLLACLALLAFSAPSFAHVVLESPTANRGTYYKAVFRVPHGCDGSATTAVAFDIPEGVISVKPMPKAGWTVATVAGKYANTYMNHGKPVSEGVKRVEWSGGRLPDDQFDEFSFLARLPDDKDVARLFFPILQTCEKGSVRWDEIPAPGVEPHSLTTPAPSLDLTAPQESLPHLRH